VHKEKTETYLVFIATLSLLSWPRLRSVYNRKLNRSTELLTAVKSISENHDVLRLVRRPMLQSSIATSLYKTVFKSCFLQPLTFILGSRKPCLPLILNIWCLAHLKSAVTNFFQPLFYVMCHLSLHQFSVSSIASDAAMLLGSFA